MDQITAAAAAGDEETVARLTDQARFEDLDRRHGATPLEVPLELLEIAADEIITNLRHEVLRAHAHGDVPGEADATERLIAFQERAGR